MDGLTDRTDWWWPNGTGGAVMEGWYGGLELTNAT